MRNRNEVEKMVEKGRGIAESSEVSIHELIEDLKRAYCDEWIAYYYYLYAAWNATGEGAPTVASELKRIAEEELEHADELAERIVQLGDSPPKNFGELAEKANCPRVDLPEDLGDLDGILRAVIEGERCALDVYGKILKKIEAYPKESATSHLIRHIMDEEMKHKETFESLLGK